MIKKVGTFKYDMENYDKEICKRIIDMFEWDFIVEPISDGTFNVYKTIVHEEENEPIKDEETYEPINNETNNE